MDTSTFLARLPAELVDQVLQEFSPEGLFVTRNICRQVLHISQSHKLLEEKAYQAGLSDSVDLIIASTETGSQSRRERMQKRTLLLNNLFATEGALNGNFSEKVSRPVFSKRVPKILPDLSPPTTTISALVDGTLTADVNTLHTFSRCGKFLISASHSHVALTSLTSGQPRCVLRFNIPEMPSLMAMDTSGDIYKLAIITTRDEENDLGFQQKQRLALYDLTGLLAGESLSSSSDPVDRSIQGVHFSTGASFQAYNEGNDVNIAFGPVQTWLEEFPPSIPSSPYTGTFPWDENSVFADVAPIPCHVVRVHSPSKIRSLAICPRTGSVAFGSRHEATIYWFDETTSQHQFLNSYLRNPADHIAFSAHPNSSHLVVIASTKKDSSPFDSTIPVNFGSIFDVQRSWGEFRGDCLAKPSSVEPLSSSTFTNTAISSVVYPLTGGIHAIYLDTSGSQLLVANCVDRRSRRAILRLEPPSGVSGLIKGVFPGSTPDLAHRVVVQYGEHIVIYSLNCLNEKAKAFKIEETRDIAIEEEEDENEDENEDDDNAGDETEVEDDETVVGDDETVVGDDEEAMAQDSEPKIEEPYTVKGVLVGAAPYSRGATMSQNQTGELFVWATSEGKLQSWRFAREAFGVIRKNDELKACEKGSIFDDGESPAMLARHLDALDLGL